MKSERIDFYERNLQHLEEYINGNPLAKQLNGDELHFVGVTESISIIEVNGRNLSIREFAKIFWLLSSSQVKIKKKNEQSDGTPGGYCVSSVCDFIEKDSTNEIIWYKSVNGDGLFIDALHISSIFFNEVAPEKLATVAFVLMAITAYKLNVHEITLIAGGGVNQEEWVPSDMVGYFVWPKFGFDAPVDPTELQKEDAVHLRKCSTVLEICEEDEGWWRDIGGSGRAMTFNLEPDSESWKALLNYIYKE